MIENIAAQALAERIAAMNAYSSVPSLAALEELRAVATDAKDQRILDLVVLSRRREAKAQLEDFDRLSDLFDKSALPAAAALPVFLTFLAGEKLLVDPWRAKVLLAAYLFGGLVWSYCRFRAFTYGRKAKLGAAALGKVD